MKHVAIGVVLSAARPMHKLSVVALGTLTTLLMVDAAWAQPFGDISSVDPSDVVIELEQRQGPCVGPCVFHYLVRVDGTGTVHFEAESPTAQVHTDQIDSSAAIGLANEILRSWWFGHISDQPRDDRHHLYRDPDHGRRLRVGGVGGPMDGRRRTLRIRVGPVEKEVSGNMRQDLPLEIRQLTDRVIEVTGVSRWLLTGR